MRNNLARKSDARPAPASVPFDQYRQLVESLTNYAIFALSVDGRIAGWNLGAERTFGYSESEVVGQSYSMIFTAEDVAKGLPESELAKTVQDGKAAADLWHVRKDGSRFWCTDTIQALYDDRGTLTGFTKLVEDASERHSSSERLRESEERLRLLIEGVTDYAIFSLDNDGKIVTWNSGAEHIFGYSEADVLGKHFSIIYTSEAIADGLPGSQMATAMQCGRAADEGWHVRRGGDLFFASGEMTLLKADDGKPRGFVKLAHDITARNKAAEKVKRQAFYDDLTQLPNRAFFSDSLRKAIARVKQQQDSRFAVIFFDLDYFKVINDSLGHVMADNLLVHVARKLEKCVRPGDTVARMGGDEFTILLGEIHNTEVATRVATRIQAELQKPVYLNGVEVFTTASMGVAIGSSSYDSPEQILRDADTAMYAAKAQGRARHVLFDSEMHARAANLLKLQMDLRRAVARQEFFVEYQPIVSLGECRVVGFEALVRWNHPERGVLQPADFIGEAENLGLIIQIDRWVLHEACRQIRTWQVQSGNFALTMSVNLSSKQFAHESLLGEIQMALDHNDLTAESLKLEITETVLMEHVEATEATVAKVEDLGVELYIDDFGTGYSSLSYLTRFPLKLLKVDRSFVSQAANKRSVEIARTVVTLAHNLGLKALAEGIETPEQASRFHALDCEFGQGFWFSKPVHPDIAQSFIGQVLPRAARPNNVSSISRSADRFTSAS